ncbi:hypothetical protein AM1_B0262 (plasmid) [Acaryochloris marina MBIC11017]|uniref:Uncharacterized protein n=1 Tax=Acaryochloris marina (strain MBIC 11017) TaxID=329726 RepID=A8ZLF3_ACAM1|nr:hypothetical protein AM1_B0262 [Acaryochloris marina MBIC11017]
MSPYQCTYFFNRWVLAWVKILYRHCDALRAALGYRIAVSRNN